MYELSGNGRKLVLQSVSLHNPSPGGVASHLDVDVTLTDGAAYIIELFLINKAGGRSMFRSETITADFTPPVCTMPNLTAAKRQHGNYFVAASADGPPGSSNGWPQRAYSYIGKDTTSIDLEVLESTCNDPQSGVSDIKIWISTQGQSGDGDVLEKRSIGIGRHELTFGKVQLQRTFWIGVACVNNANVEGMCPSENVASVRVDRSPPVCRDNMVSLGTGMQAMLPKSYQSDTSSLALSRWGGAMEDPETGILKMNYALRDMDTGSTVQLPDYTHANLPPPVMKITGLTLAHGRSYAVEFSPINYVEIRSTCITKVVMIDATAPSAGRVVLLQNDADNDVPDPPENRFQYSTKVMRIANRKFVDAESGIEAFYVTVYRTDGWLILPETVVGTRLFAVIAVDLEHEQSFYVRWRAINRAGLSVNATSINITVDATPPIILYVRDGFPDDTPHLDPDDPDLVRGMELEVGTIFDAYDPESGLKSAYWCLGSFPGACDVFQQTNLPNFWLWEAGHSVRALIDGVTYYSLITVTNNAGNLATAVSNGFKIDISPPECGLIQDGPGYDLTFVGPTLAEVLVVEGEESGKVLLGKMPMAWQRFDDKNDVVAGYAAAIVSSSLLDRANATNVEWVQMGLGGSTLFYMPLVHAETYYGVVSVWDRLGNERKCYSDGALYDDTPPDMSQATMDSFLAYDYEYNKGWPHRGLVQRITHLVHGEILGVVDPESDIRQYYGSIGLGSDIELYASMRSLGTSEGEVLMGGLSLPDGLVNFTVKAVNRAMEPSYTALTVGVDTGIPTCSWGASRCPTGWSTLPSRR
jgi:hypothetical protein